MSKPETVPGFRVGHAQDLQALTGCTVILCPPGTVGGVDQRGGAPGTRETDLLAPMHLVNQVHAVLLTGGSAFGLDAASGVMRFLEEQGVGLQVGAARVPIVPAAVLFDLGLGAADVRPDAAMGYQACQHAVEGAVAEGNLGAGTGASVGKVLGMPRAMKSGVGTAGMSIGGGGIVQAVVAVNAFGDILDPETGEIAAGARGLNGPLDTLRVMKTFVGRKILKAAAGSQNTVIGAVMTNVRLTKDQTNKMAAMAHNGLARTVRPAFSMLDGDTVFALSAGEVEVDLNIVGAYAAQVYARAILRAVQQAPGAGGLPGAADQH